MEKTGDRINEGKRKQIGRKGKDEWRKIHMDKVKKGKEGREERDEGK